MSQRYRMMMVKTEAFQDLIIWRTIHQDYKEAVGHYESLFFHSHICNHVRIDIETLFILITV
jgi:hypothetical protein